jgi:uncharacterized membrane protein
MALLLIALFGLFVPNGIFIYWMLTEFNSMSDFFTNRLALGFILEAFLVLGMLTYYFAKNPIGKFKWPWLVVFSLIGGLGFGLPFYYWLNKRT